MTYSYEKIAGQVEFYLSAINMEMTGKYHLLMENKKTNK